MVHTFLELDVRLSTPVGAKEMRQYARAETRRREASIESIDLEEFEEVAEAAQVMACAPALLCLLAKFPLWGKYTNSNISLGVHCTQATGLSVAQLRTLIISQFRARLDAKHGSESEEECCGEGSDGCVDGTTIFEVDDDEGYEVVLESAEAAARESEAIAAAAAATATTAEPSAPGLGSPSSDAETTDEVASDESDATVPLEEESKHPVVSEAAEGGAYAALRPVLRKGGVGVESGATAVVAVLDLAPTAEAPCGLISVANAGDSRCVLARWAPSAPGGGGKGAAARPGAAARAAGRFEAVELSEDHKPEDAGELARITAAGGTVVEGRVEGNLNLSRAIGDTLYKRNLGVGVEAQMITALPEVRRATLGPGDCFVVLACDGIWNVLESQEVVDFVAERLVGGGGEQRPLATPEALGRICEELLAECLAPDMEGDGSGCDNMTAMIVLLPCFDRAAAAAAAAGAAAAVAPGAAVGAKRAASGEVTEAPGMQKPRPS